MRHAFRFAALAWSSLALAGAACAGTVQLTVTDKEGNPVPDVVVLIESSAKAAAVPAPAPVVIVQEGSRFVPFLSVVPAGSTLRFVNRDSYDHHVRSTPSGPLGNLPPVADFELRLDAGVAAPASPNDEYKSPAPARNSTSRHAAAAAEAVEAAALSPRRSAGS